VDLLVDTASSSVGQPSEFIPDTSTAGQIARLLAVIDTPSGIDMYTFIDLLLEYSDLEPRSCTLRKAIYSDPRFRRVRFGRWTLSDRTRADLYDPPVPDPDDAESTGWDQSVPLDFG